MASPTFGMAQVHVPSPPRPFNYAFSMSQSSGSHNHGQSAQTPTGSIAPEGWNDIRGQPSDPNNLLYSQDSTANGFYYNSSGQTPTGATFDQALYYDQEGFNALTLAAGSSGNTPPYAHFATPGLPFAGLDFIRNYNPDGFSAGNNDDSLWQTIDPGAFQYEPDIPWGINDLPVVDEGQERQD